MHFQQLLKRIDVVLIVDVVVHFGAFLADELMLAGVVCTHQVLQVLRVQYTVVAVTHTSGPVINRLIDDDGYRFIAPVNLLNPTNLPFVVFCDCRNRLSEIFGIMAQFTKKAGDKAKVG